MRFRRIKIVDLDKSKQTDEIKKEVYDLIKQFVYKNQKRYYPHFQGEIDDIVYNLFTEFLEQKTHRNGEVFSELDRFDPSKIGGDVKYNKLATYVKTFVVKSLIDAERTDKRETRYTEKYNEETGDLSLDFLINKVAEKDTQVDEIEFSDKDYRLAKEKFEALPKSAKNKFISSYKESRSALSKNFVDLFDTLVEVEEPKNTIKEPTILDTIKGFAPEGVTVNLQNIKLGEAVRFQMPDKTPVNEFLDKETLDTLTTNMQSLEYKPYVIRGNSLYFIKTD